MDLTCVEDQVCGSLKSTVSSDLTGRNVECGIADTLKG